MSDNQKTKGPNELKRTNHIISEQIAKIQKDTQELINRTIDGQPSKVSVVKISENKIIIEVDLNETNQSLKNIENLVDQPENSENKLLKENQSSNNTSSNLATKSKTKLDKDNTSIDRKSNLNSQSNLDLDTSCDENKPLKGILKYTNSWKKRTLSESSFDYSSSFTSDHEDEENNLSLSCSDLDCYTTDKSLKKVTFNKQISSKIFSRNQRTIETKKRGKKNKKNSNKKTKGNDDKKQMTQQLSNEQQIEKSEFLTNENLVKEKSNMSNVSIDELSFLLCSSEESDTSNIPLNDIIDLKSTNKSTNKNDASIQDDDDLLFDQKIDYQTLDKENWSEMKSSKKVKKNRKRNDSNNSAANSTTMTQTNNSESTDNPNNQEENCEKESNVGKQMSLGFKNLIQVN